MRLRSIGWLLVGLGVVGLAPPVIVAAEAQSAKAAPRKVLAVESPSGEHYDKGDYATVRWRKNTGGLKVNAELFYSDELGRKKSKARNLSVPEPTPAWTTTGGSFDWRVPDSLASGTYVIVVSSRGYTAASGPFTVGDVSQLSAAVLKPEAKLQGIDVYAGGTAGKITLEEAGRRLVYHFGGDGCPKLDAGVAGALVKLAARGNVVVQPRVRQLRRGRKVVRECLDGFILENVAPK